MANYNDAIAFISYLLLSIFQRLVGTIMTPSSKYTPAVSFSVSSEVTFILPALHYDFIFHI